MPGSSCAVAAAVSLHGSARSGARGRSRLNVLDKRLARARLKPGTRLEVWIVARGRGGKVVRFTIQDKVIPIRARLCVEQRARAARAPTAGDRDRPTGGLTVRAARRARPAR